MENFKSKKIIGFFSLAVMLIMMGCKDQPVQKEVIVPVTVEKPVIIEKTVTVEKEVPAENSTNITLDKNGVKVEAKKINVSIEK